MNGTDWTSRIDGAAPPQPLVAVSFQLDDRDCLQFPFPAKFLISGEFGIDRFDCGSGECPYGFTGPSTRQVRGG